MIDAPEQEHAGAANGAVPSEFEQEFRPGATVEVLSKDNRLIFVGRVDSWRGEAVVIREAKDNDLPMALYNKEVKLRFFRERGNPVLKGKVCGSTNLIWKVDRLEKMFTKEQRAFFRQGISTNIEGKCTRRIVQGGRNIRVDPCRVLDISAGGMLIASKEEYVVNDRLSVFSVYFTKREGPFSFNCQVRRVGEPDAGGMRRYGCKFEALSPKEQDRLLRAIFAVQREEIRSQKERDGM